MKILTAGTRCGDLGGKEEEEKKKKRRGREGEEKKKKTDSDGGEFGQFFFSYVEGPNGGKSGH